MLAPRAEDRAIDTVESYLPPVTLVLGGAASGKSKFSESLIEVGFGERWAGACYLATATSGDGEMAEKIARHRERRGAEWVTVEEPIALSETLRKVSQAQRPILVDCLTLWLSNLMFAGRDTPQETKILVEAFPSLPGPVVLVSNDVGGGIVPDNALARRFREEAGQLNQAIAAAANRVYFVTAGLPMTLKNKVP